MSVSFHQEGVGHAGVIAVVIEGLVQVLEVLLQPGPFVLVLVQDLEVEILVPVEAQEVLPNAIECVL